MIWKTTLEKKFWLTENVKSLFHLKGYSSLLRKISLLFLLLSSSLNLFSQDTANEPVGDDCITFSSCPEDQVLCATQTVDGLGAYVEWLSPVITQTCTGNGQEGNFQMLFELNEQLLTEECWEFNWISRVGGSGGHIKLFSGNDNASIDKSFVTSPYLILADSAETSFEVKYSAPKGQESYTYTIQLFLVDENGVETPSGGPYQVTKDQTVYHFNTENPGDAAGVYRLKYVFEFSGDTPSNANTGDTMIAVDGILYDTGCSGGIDFTVTGPHKGFYPVGVHDLAYVATYTSPSGVVRSKTCSFNVTVSAMEVSVSDIVNASCGTNNGSFTAVASHINGSGTGPYEYSIDGINYQSSGEFTDLGPDTYTVNARDTTNCTLSSTEVTITQPETPEALVSNGDIRECKAETIQELNANTAITSATEVVWYDAATGGNIVENPVLNLVGSLTYWAEAISEEGCSSPERTSVTLTIDEVIAEITGSYLLTCEVTSVTLKGDGTSSNLNQDLSFSWSGPEGFTSNEAEPEVTLPGIYTLTVTDIDSGCSDETTVTVDQNINAVTADITGEENILTCTTTSITLDAGGSSVNGTAAYEWSNGADGSSIEVTAPGTYTVTVTDTVNGCSSTASVTVEQNINAVTADITGGENILTCTNTTVTLDASGSIVKGTASYLWSTGAETASINVTTPGNYTVTVIDTVNGCSDNFTVTVDQNIAPVTAEIAGNEVLTCDVTTITLDASGSTVNGSASYQWSTGAETASIDVTTPGDYKVTVTDSVNGCSSEVTVTVDQNIAPVTAEISGNEILTCEVTTVTLDASGSTVSGTASYLWSNNATSSSIEVTEPGTYLVTVTDTVNGCSSTDSVTVEQNINAVTANITGEENILTCTNTTVTLDASASEVEGNASYLWSNGETSASIVVTTPGEYSVVVTDLVNGCSNERLVNVAQDISPVTAIITGDEEILTCENQTVTLDASGSTVNGTASYLWSTGAETASIDVTSAGEYTVTVTDTVNGCFDEITVTVDQNIALVTAEISGNETLTCEIQTITLNASGSTVNGTPSYLWSTGADTASIDVTSPGEYTVTVTDTVNGCSDEITITVDQNIAPVTAEISGNEILTCEIQEITLDASGSTVNGTASYLWSTGAETASIDVTTPGDYKVTVTDIVNGCSDEITVTVNQDSNAVLADISGNETLTCAVTTVTLDASASTVNGIASYLWSTGAETASINVTTPGDYKVTVTDTVNGCSDELTVTVNQDINEVTAEISGNENLTCDVTTITLDAGESTVSGTASYLWSTGAETASIDVTIPGDYTVTVIDTVNGCSDEITVTVDQDIAPVTVEISGNETLTCDVTTITLDASGSTVSGTASYLWSTGAETASIDVISSGDYTVTVTDTENGCSDEFTVTVNQDIAPVTAEINGNDTLTCEVTTITLDASGSTVSGTASYLWSTGAETSTINVTAPGDYTVTVTDTENGCSDEFTVTVNQDIAPVTAEINGNDTLTCEVTTITLDASGSTVSGTAAYLWSTGAETASIDVSTPGDYIVTVTDTVNGCSDETTVTVDQNIAPVTAAISGNESLTCDVTTITLDASGSTVSGTASYQWSTGAETATIDVTTPGDYTVTVIDTVNGCSDETTVTVDQNIAPVTAAISGNEILTCDVTSIILDASGSTVNGTVSYLWSTGAETATIDVNSPGDYTVTVTDTVNGCSDELTVTVEQNINAVAAIISGNEILTCAVQAITLDASGSTVNGTASYLWSTGAETATIDVTTPGDYTVTVTDILNECSDEITVTVEQNITPVTAAISGNETLSCEVTTITLDAGESTVSGTASYLWSTGAETATIDVTSPGDYTVTVTDTVNGCSDEVTVTVEQNIAPVTAAISGNETLTCDVTSITLDASESTVSGTASYLWSTGAETATIDVNSPGDYTVTVTDTVNGCSDELTVTVEQNINAVAAIISGNEILTCAVQAITLDASGSSVNGTASYLWSTGAETATIDVTTPGDYTVTVTDILNECSDEITVTVEQNITPVTAAISGNETLTCEVTSVTLDASGSTVNGTASYLWSTGAETTSIDATTPGDYTVTVTDTVNGCSDQLTVTVDQNIAPVTAAISGNETLTCAVTTVTLDASGSTVSGTSSYLWSTGAETATIVVTSPGDYKVTVTDTVNGCSDEITVTVDQNIAPVTAEISGNETLTCAVTTVTLDASGSTVSGTASYLWSTGAETAAIDVTTPGDYKVNVTDTVNGCFDEVTVTVDQNIAPVTAEISGNQTLTCDVTTVTLTASGSTVSGPASYVWNTGAETASIDVTSPGEYTVTVTDTVNGCSDDVTVTVDQNIAPVTAAIAGNEVLTCEVTTITLDAGESTVSGTASYLWSTGAETATIDVTSPGDYTVTVTDTVNGCSDEITVTVDQNIAPVTAAISGNETLTCDVTTITLDASGSTVNGTASYLWSTGAETASIDATTPGEYTVTVTNTVNGCSNTASVVVEAQQAAPSLPEVVEIDQPDCFVATGSIKVLETDGIEFSIDGINFSAQSAFEDLFPGTYNITGKNIYGCVSEATTVTINPQPTTPAGPEVSETVQPTCDVATGSFTVTSTQGLEYSIDGEIFSASGSFEGLAAGTYFVTARNTDGCVSEATSVTIDPQPTTPAVPEVSETVQPTCDLATGSFTVTVVEGHGYSIDGENYSATGTFEDLVAGTYNITARNADGCVSEAISVTIDPQPAAPAGPEVSETVQPTCNVAAGSFTVTFTEGLEYSIDGENYSATGTFEDLVAGTYNITARNADGCVSEATSVTIDPQPAAPAAPVVSEINQPTCDIATGSFIVNLVEGLEFSIDNDNFQTSGEFDVLNPGTYHVVARNASGCISEPVTITINEVSDPEPIEANDSELCIEDSPYDLSDLLVGEFNENGTWSDVQNTGALVNSFIDPSLLEVGTYTFEYIIEEGCGSTTTVQLSINDDCVVLACGIEDIKGSISKTVTPNGDNRNDLFEIGLDIDCDFTYNVKVFNRWGNEVFSSGNYQNNWNGSSSNAFSGDKLPSGTYYYIVEINNQTAIAPIQGYIYLGTN